MCYNGIIRWRLGKMIPVGVCFLWLLWNDKTFIWDLSTNLYLSDWTELKFRLIRKKARIKHKYNLSGD